MKIEYVPKKELYPAFGRAFSDQETIYIRADLPDSVQKFIKDHEIYHLTDKTKWWVWREIKANIYGAIKHPIGFVYCVFLSLSWYRLKFYITRIKRGNKMGEQECGKFTIRESETTKIDLSLPTDLCNISFCKNNNSIGQLNWSSGELVFDGNAQESAQVFFDYLKPLMDNYIRRTK